MVEQGGDKREGEMLCDPLHPFLKGDLDLKASILELKRFAVHDGDGIRTTVFFKGCPLRCVWCHNPEGIAFGKELSYLESKCIGCGECVSACPTAAHNMVDGAHTFDRTRCIGCGACDTVCLGNALKLYGREMTVEELMPMLLEDREFYEQSGGGVTLSGGECLMQADFCAALLENLKKEGIQTAVDTCGAVTQAALEQVMPYTDVFLYDVKAIDEQVHRRCTGASNRKILENLAFLDAQGAKIEVRIPYVPHYNDGEMAGIAAHLASLRNLVGVRVLPYHNYAGSKYQAIGIEHTLPALLPTKDELEGARNILTAVGLRVIGE
ncbi:MAG: glycyl-radical enzyme activating protein [Clostridia bacterium]|nr:glycyl-radical enzyme activating protein [Clostridia bacterium]